MKNSETSQVSEILFRVFSSKKPKLGFEKLGKKFPRFPSLLELANKNTNHYPKYCELTAYISSPSQ